MMTFDNLRPAVQQNIKRQVEEGKPSQIIYDVDSTPRRFGVMVDYLKSDGSTLVVQYFFDKDGFLKKAKKFTLP